MKTKLRPAAHVLDKRGRIKLHPFEQPHDDPAPCNTCWYCLKPRKARVHKRGKR